MTTNQPARAAESVALLFEHEDGRYAVNPDTTNDPKWHRLGPVDVSALAQPEPAVVAESAEQRAVPAEAWRKQFWEVARMVKCLPSSYPEENSHVLKKLSALVREAPRDGANMPDAWSVLVEVAGDRLVCIEQDALSGKRNLSDAEEQTIIGAAQHLLAFVGYGLPPSGFDPSEDDGN